MIFLFGAREAYSDTYTQCDVASYTLIKPEFAKDAERCRESSLQVRALFVFVVKLGRAWEVELYTRQDTESAMLIFVTVITYSSCLASHPDQVREAQWCSA